MESGPIETVFPIEQQNVSTDPTLRYISKTRNKIEDVGPSAASHATLWVNNILIRGSDR